uniref:Integrase, catalytic region, zinc finger, CCHC-type, peptidase aspartic, catalytic n=1 Tax=Tanacetum cinerariifolium TaxID=118510 RepID=A0A699GS57_TANCI|nr:integrase, catalytic region, zinc finger, CCHC-type, peptidase aspartic, catalytic [Tanacetum cinerariifolium]
MGDRFMGNNSQGKKQEVEDQRRNDKLPKNKTFVTAFNETLNAKILNVKYVFAMCNKCVLNDKHDMCVLNSVAKPNKKTVVSESNQKLRNITRKIYERVSKTCSWWYPKFIPSGCKWKPKSGKENVNPNLVEIVLFIIDSRCSKHMLLINFVEKFLGTVKFGNDQIAPILGFGDLVQGDVMIKRVYYVEGLNHNLFFVGQFCDADLEVAFRKSMCFIHDLKGNDLLIGEIKDFKNKNKSLESSNNSIKEANNKLSETNNLLYADYKKSEAELARRNSKEYALQMELECEKARGDLLSYKMDYHKSCTKYTDTINALNQTISEMKDKLSAHQETISILSQQKEAQTKLYKTREDMELDKVIELEQKVKVLDNTVYKTGQSVQTMNMLNNKCRTSFAQRENPRLYDIGCYNDNLVLMLALDSDEVIRLEKESRSKLSDLIRPFVYDKLNNLYDLFVPQREKSSKQHYFSERSRLSHINVNNGKSKEPFHKQTTLLEKRMDESIQLDKQLE